METRYWLLLTSRRTLESLIEAQEWVFGHRVAQKARDVRSGDVGFVYVTADRGTPGTIAAEIQFTGAVALRDDRRYAAYPWVAPIRLLRPLNIPFKELVPELSFVGNKSSWQSYLQGQALRPLGETDANAILHQAGVPQ